MLSLRVFVVENRKKLRTVNRLHIFIEEPFILWDGRLFLFVHSGPQGDRTKKWREHVSGTCHGVFDLVQLYKIAWYILWYVGKFSCIDGIAEYFCMKINGKKYIESCKFGGDGVCIA